MHDHLLHRAFQVTKKTFDYVNSLNSATQSAPIEKQEDSNEVSIHPDKTTVHIVDTK